jgi:CheY-like chemotaxis protein
VLVCPDSDIRARDAPSCNRHAAEAGIPRTKIVFPICFESNAAGSNLAQVTNSCHFEMLEMRASLSWYVQASRMSRVLVVDDDRSVVFMLTEVLREAGHEVVAASTSEQALTLAVGIDAALIDLHLQGECGEALIARLREQHATLPVILLTGDSRHGKPGPRTPSLDVMTKPLDIDELARVLSRALSCSASCAVTAQ